MLIEDVGVPLPRVAELITGIERVAEKRRHDHRHHRPCGRRQLPPARRLRSGDAAAVARAELAFGEVMDLAISLGGTITGEHGVGTLKRGWLEEQIGTDVLSVMRDVKHALDPLGILNPGKAI